MTGGLEVMALRRHDDISCCALPPVSRSDKLHLPSVPLVARGTRVAADVAMRFRAEIGRWLGRSASLVHEIMDLAKADAGKALQPFDAKLVADPDVAVYRVSPAYSIGSLVTTRAVMASIGDRHMAFIVDFAEAAALDNFGASLVAWVVKKARHRGVAVIVSGAAPHVRQTLVLAGVGAPDAEFAVGLRKHCR